MATYNTSSSYNRTYEKKVIEESPRIRITSHAPFATHILPAGFGGFALPSTSPGLGFGSSSCQSLRTTDDSFHATIDAKEYAPEDLKVSVVDKYIVVEASHPERADELGLISRSFVRKFELPPLVQPEAVTSNLTSEGVLTIVALPPKPKESSPARSIPIKVVTSASTTPQASPAPSATATEESKAQ